MTAGAPGVLRYRRASLRVKSPNTGKEVRLSHGDSPHPYRISMQRLASHLSLSCLHEDKSGFNGSGVTQESMHWSHGSYHLANKLDVVDVNRQAYRSNDYQG